MRLRIVSVFWSVVLVSPLYAQTQHSLNGFASLGAVSSSNENLAFRRDLNVPDGSSDGDVKWKMDSLVGLQWNGRWSDNWDATIQLVVKDRFENSVANSVEWAFVHYRIEDGLDLRLGRVGADLFAMSEYRQVGYALPWVRPPHDTYAFLSFYHYDGLDLTKRFDFKDAFLNIKIFYGISDEDYPASYGPDLDAGVNIKFDFSGITLNYEEGYWKWRSSYVVTTIKNEMVPQLIQPLLSVSPLWPEASGLAEKFTTKGTHFNYGEIGVTYDNNQWWVRAELVDIDTDSELISNGNFGYLSVGKRIKNYSIYLLSGFAKPANNIASIQPPVGPDPTTTAVLQLLAEGAETAINGVRADQTSVGVGLRWDFAPKMAIKVQYERFSIQSKGSGLWLKVNNTDELSDQSSNVISLAWDVLF